MQRNDSRTGTEPVRARPATAAARALLAACGLPTDDLTDERMQDFYYCGSAAEPYALVGLEFCGSDALLRSLAVTAARRSGGLATRLVRHVEGSAREKGVRSIYLLTTTAERFFLGHGYVAADRRAAPAGIRATREFTEICPEEAAFLVKRL